MFWGIQTVLIRNRSVKAAKRQIMRGEWAAPRPIQHQDGRPRAVPNIYKVPKRVSSCPRHYRSGRRRATGGVMAAIPPDSTCNHVSSSRLPWRPLARMTALVPPTCRPAPYAGYYETIQTNSAALSCIDHFLNVRVHVLEWLAINIFSPR